MLIPRFLTPKIEARLFQGKAILLLGPRQVGKTTLLRTVAASANMPYLWLDCDEPDVRALLSDATSTRLRSVIGSYKLVMIDEAQRVRNIGITLKLLTDQFPDVQVVATGSAALELANSLNEPLTGRKIEFRLFPISVAEYAAHKSPLDAHRMLEQYLRFGLYPDILSAGPESPMLLTSLADSYLYKDLLVHEGVRKPALLEKLLQALALQIGSEVSTQELAQLLGVDRQTIDRYVDLLEKSYVIFSLRSLSRNLRNELKKSRKIYFYDVGIRNAIIKNFNLLEMRQDVGALWENFLMAERLKNNHYTGRMVNAYFWRTHQQQELDYLEESGGKIDTFEYKWSTNKVPKQPASFAAAYPNCSFTPIMPNSYLPFVGVDTDM